MLGSSATRGIDQGRLMAGDRNEACQVRHSCRLTIIIHDHLFALVAHAQQFLRTFLCAAVNSDMRSEAVT